MLIWPGRAEVVEQGDVTVQVRVFRRDLVHLENHPEISTKTTFRIFLSVTQTTEEGRERDVSTQIKTPRR